MTPRPATAASRTAARALAVIVVSSAIARTAWSQSLLGRVPEAGVFTSEYQNYRLGMSDSVRTARTTMRSMVRLPLAGVLLHENVARYSLSVSPVLRQIRTSSLADTQSERLRELGFQGNAWLLAETPFPISLQALRQSGSRYGDFGTHEEFEEALRAAEVWWRNPFLPMSASVSQRRLRDTWYRSLMELPLARDERYDAVRWSGNNSKSAAAVEHSDFTDLQRGTRVQTRLASIANTLRWGKGSTLASNGSRNDVSGMTEYSRRFWSQSAHVQHTPAVRSNASYTLYSTGSGDRSNSGDAEELSLTARLSPGFHLGFRGRRSAARFGAGEATMMSAGPMLSYGRNFGRRLSVSANAAVYQDWHRRTLHDRRAYVLDEPFTVDSTRRITLRRPSVDAASLQVQRADRTQIYSAGLDYQVFATEITTELTIIPGGRIAIGDSLLLTYEFLLPAQQPETGTSSEFGTTVTSGPLSLFYRRLILGSQSPMAVDFVTISTDEVVAGGRFMLERGLRSLDISAEEHRRAARGLTYVTRQGRVGLSARSLGGTVALLQLAVNRTVAGDLETQDASATGGVSWWASRAFRLSTEVRGWTWRATNFGSQRLLGGAMGAEFQMGLLSFFLRWEAYAREYGSAPGRESILTTRLARRF